MSTLKFGLVICAILFITACQPNTGSLETPVNESSLQTEDSVVQSGQPVSQGYQPFTPAAFAAASDQRRVLFFHAKWCPTCKALDNELRANLRDIPEGVVVFQTDYDDEQALKQKYGITYQHTLVEVDAAGNEVRKWNGGDMAELQRQLSEGS